MENEDYDLCLESYNYVFKQDLLRNKVAFITGGGSGICFTIAEVFMRHGCKVAIASRNVQRLEKACRKLQNATGGSCLAIALDVRKPQTILAAVEKTVSEFGQIDILINGAAGNFLCPAKNLSFNAFKTVMEIDALGTFNVSKAVYDISMKNTGGVIINITATLHHRGDALQTHAGSAKAAIEAMTRHLAVEWGPDKIRVLCVAPGPISDTEGFRRLGGPSIPDEYIASIPVQRLGTKVDIANTTLSAVSDVSSLLTGSTLVADGGCWLTESNNYLQRLSLYDMYNRKSKL